MDRSRLLVLSSSYRYGACARRGAINGDQPEPGEISRKESNHWISNERSFCLLGWVLEIVAVNVQGWELQLVHCEVRRV